MEQDPQETLKWFNKAAEQGNESAQYHLGLLYYHTKSADGGYSQAAIWYRKAAIQGNVESQYMMGVIYSNGHGVKQDHAEAAQWYMKAALNGHVEAQRSGPDVLLRRRCRKKL